MMLYSQRRSIPKSIEAATVRDISRQCCQLRTARHVLAMSPSRHLPSNKNSTEVASNFIQYSLDEINRPPQTIT